MPKNRKPQESDSDSDEGPVDVTTIPRGLQYHVLNTN